ncbi:MAG: preprotein translocase subunit SecE [Bacteroidales bacterium]|nr:preprotein translocase subunit SecE [Bacteroidales bacterium]
MINYFKESYNELMNKVTWPSWAELQGSSIIVMVASVIFALIILAMDYSFKNIMHLVYSLF